MAADEGKKEEEKFEFDSTGEPVGWIGMDQARVRAMQVATETPGVYGSAYSSTPKAFEVAGAEETEDHYIIDLSLRPKGDFTGIPGLEQFFIEKEGSLVHRQVLRLPSRARWRRSPVRLVSIGIGVVVALVIVGVIAIITQGDSGDVAALASSSTSPAESPGPPLSSASATATASPAGASIPTGTPSVAPPVVVAATTSAVPGIPNAGATPTSALPKPRLLHWWPGDGNAVDIVGGNDGALLGGTSYAQGKAGQAFSFGGGESRVTLSSQPVLTTGLTISVWVNFDDENFDGYQEIFNNNQFFLRKGSRSEGNLFQLYVQTEDSNVEPGVRGVGAPLPDTWYHVVGTWDGAVARIYIDGRRRGLAERKGRLTANTSPAQIGLGEQTRPSANPFFGLIDEVAIFNYALSEEDVQALYNGGGPAYLISMPLGEEGDTHQATLAIGESMQIVADVQDSDGNRVGSSLIAWQITPDVGSLDDDGIFTAGTKAGTFPSGIQVDVLHEGERASAVIAIIVEPGPAIHIRIEPAELVVQQGETATLLARGSDEYRNPVPAGLLFLWEAEGGISVDQTGAVTAGEQGGTYQISAQASFDGGRQTASATVIVPPVWITAGNMTTERGTHTATLLPDGYVLIVGGRASAEIYDPLSRTFASATTNCDHGGWPQANLLADGTELITGGSGDARCAEIYDPNTRKFSRVGSLNTDHWGHTATLLEDGRVLIAGGQAGAAGSGRTHAVAELYDPEKRSFSPTGSLNIDRHGHTATLLPDGQVLITLGERTGTSGCSQGAEIHDSGVGRFDSISSSELPASGCGGTATLLPNNKVLIAQGGTAVLFDVASFQFEATGNMIAGRAWGTATMLSTGQVLFADGRSGPSLATAETYGTSTGTFSETISMGDARDLHTATLLSEGTVLVAGGLTYLATSTGGVTQGNDLRSAELWIPDIR